MSERKPVVISYDPACTPKPCIKIYNDQLYANGNTSMEANDAIAFFNGLGKNVNAKIKFYNTKQDKNDESDPITDFCVGQDTAEFTVAIQEDCLLNKVYTKKTHIWYHVEATGFNALDPVIIIEPGTASLNWVLPAVVLLVVAGASFWFGKSRKS